MFSLNSKRGSASAKNEAPQASREWKMGRDIFFPNQIEDHLEERCKLPQRYPGGASAKNKFGAF